MKQILTFLFLFSLTQFLPAQSGAQFWSNTSAQPSQGQAVLPNAYRSLSLDITALANYLREAPMERTAAAENNPLVLALPMPDGSMEEYALWEAPIMAPELAATYPMIKTYAGRSTVNPAHRMRLHLSPFGFHAVSKTLKGTALIVPMEEDQTTQYLSFYMNDVEAGLENLPAELCGVHTANWDGMGYAPDPVPAGNEIKTTNRGVESVIVNNQKYRLAVATTVEFSAAHGNNVTSVLNHVTLLMNAVNLVMESENAITLELIPNTTEVFFFGPNGSDPYTNGNTGAMIDQNPPVLNDSLGISSYDIGHVFGTNAGGLASTGSVCNGDAKGRGVSCEFGAYSGLLFYLIVAHEMGHQFNALHTFNLCDMENESPNTAYEPGSGSTIMCYAGASDCGSNYVQNMDDNYYHINSLIRIRDFSRDNASGGACDQLVPVGNNTPEVNIPIEGGFFIPISTPFELTGAATDPDGDDMTYVWEQYDLGPPSPLGQPIGTAPLFRSRPPTSSPTRVFPQMATIVSNSTDKTEVLPTITRPLTFRFTARDNNAPAGGWGFEEIQFNATATAGPFLVTQPNTSGINWEVGDYNEVTWDVANTTNNLVNSHWVNIKLSTDGGFTYPITLLAQTPNDGSAFVVVPDEVTTTARIRVEAADNIFFDISNQNFSIVPAAAPGFSLVQDIEYGTACIPDDFEVELQTAALLGFSENITFTASDLPPGATATFSPNPVEPGESTTLMIDMSNVTVDGTYEITISAGAAGVPTQERTVSINVVYSDFSALVVTSPVNGASGETLLPTFQWTALPNALFYDIEIATSPTFGNTVVADSFGLEGTTYMPDVTLQENKLYFWRIRSHNECGSGEFSDAATFYTVAQSCTTYPSNHAPITIPGSGLPYITSKVTVPQGTTVSDVNVKNIMGNHNAFGDVAFRLKSPLGDSVVLMNGAACGSSNAFNFGFDDQSPVTTIPCVPSTGANYKPANPLSAFNGINGQGEWTFVMAVINTIGDGGTFNSWALEVCGTASPNDPTLTKNDTLCALPGGEGLIYTDYLVVEDSDNSPDQLTFTIVTNPSEGFLTKNGDQLDAGQTFTMQDVYEYRIGYTNTNASAAYDYFTFAVTDGTGGLLGTPKAVIKMDPLCVVGTAEANSQEVFQVYPNPASGLVNVALKSAGTGMAKVSLLNVAGKMLMERELDMAAGIWQLQTGNVAAGIYLLQVATEKGVFTQKIILE